MKKILFVSFLLLSQLCLAQGKYHALFGMCSLRCVGDTVTCSNPSYVEIAFDQLSEITPIYFNGDRTYGVRFEIFESRINDHAEYFLRTSFYLKTDTLWRLIDESPTPIKIHLGREEPIIQDIFKCNYTSSNPEFSIEYTQFIYVKKVE